MLKPYGDPNRPKWEGVDHCHFFHTVDSNGRPQKFASSIGGHTHEVKVKVNENGELETFCGPPVKRQRNRKGELLPDGGINPLTKKNLPIDDHTHDISYLDSHTVKPRKRTAEAMAVQKDFAVPSAPRE